MNGVEIEAIRPKGIAEVTPQGDTIIERWAQVNAGTRSKLPLHCRTVD